MKNPVLGSAKNVLVYCLIWSTVLVPHYYFDILFQVPTHIAIVDTFVFTAIYAFFGIPVWYLVIYSDSGKISFWKVLLNHVFTSTVIVFLWLSLGIFIMSLIFEDYTSCLPENTFFFPIIVFGYLYYTIMALIFYMIMFYNKFKEKVFGEAELIARVSEAELNALKSQVNPHFLFNSLNSVNSLTITNPDKAREMLVKLSDFMRYSLAHGNNQKIPLKQEVENIERYLEIEKVRFGEKLHFVNETDSSISGFLIPALILQPLIENCVKHGVYEATETIRIQLRCINNNGNLQILLGNNFDPEAPSRKGTGIGINNIARRLELIYKRNDLMKVKKSPAYFEVNLIIPQT